MLYPYSIWQIKHLFFVTQGHITCIYEFFSYAT